MPQAMSDLAEELRLDRRRIAFVPTMGYLHEGHASLIRLAREEADVVVTSIFVNPMQFGPQEDYEQYPRDLERDAAIAAEAGSDYLFCPAAAAMYPEGFGTRLRLESEITAVLEGAARPGHFDGVATVVAKLFAIVRPHIAVFGQKDYQQCLVVQQVVRDMNIPIRILIAPTQREEGGLALSSRNKYLAERDRQAALQINAALRAAATAVEAGASKRAELEKIMTETLRQSPDLALEYAAAAAAETLERPPQFASGSRIALLIAARLGSTRLIDNLLVDVPSGPGTQV